MSISVISRLGTRWAGAAATACILCVPAWAGAADADQATGAAGQSAVWTQKEVTFVYMGFTTKYSCDGLRDKVKGVLLDLGAQKKDLKVSEFGCTFPYGRPDPFPGVRVKMSVLQPTGAPGADDKQPPVQAHWKPVDLKLRDSLSNDSGECELVEQIRTKLVPLFATRDVDLKDNCIPHQESATRPSLKMQVLVLDKSDDKAAVASR